MGTTWRKKYSEKKYSRSLAVVWGAEYFRNYVLGRPFTVITDHKALFSLLNGNNKKNKTLVSRLSRWLERLTKSASQITYKDTKAAPKAN